MTKRKKKTLAKRMAAAALSLLMAVAMLPFSVFAAADDGKASDLLSLDGQPPAGFDPSDTTNPYGYDVNEPFMMAAQNELLHYVTYDGNVNTTVSKGFRLESVSNNITASQMNGKKAFKDTSTLGETKRYSFVQGVAFDPAGSGRKDYVAYIGYDNANGRVVVWVVNANTGNSSVAYHAGYADWIKNAGIEQFYAGNFFAITAGRYKDAPGETFVTYSPLGDGNYCLKEWRIYIGDDGGISMDNGAMATSSTYLHDTYRKAEWEGPKMAKSGVAKNMLSVSMATGDFNADGVDDLAVLSYLNRPESNYRKINTEFFAPQLTLVRGGGSGTILNRTDVSRTMLRENISGDKDDYITWHTLRSPAVAAGDVDGDGYDEILVGGYTAYTYSKKGSENFNADTPYERQSAVTVAGYSYAGGKADKILFESYKHEDGKSIMNKYTEQIVAKHNDDVMPAFMMETVALDGGANPEYLFVNGTFCLLNEDGTLEHKYTPDYFTRWDSKAGDMDNISRNFIESAAVGVFDDNTIGREQIAVSVGMKESGEDDYAFMLGMMGGRNYKDIVKDGEIVSYGKLGYYYTTGFDKSSYDYWESDKKRYDVYNQGEYQLNCIVVAVDTGYDGTVARYKDKTFAYSNPTVTAVLQAAPYFGEFDNTEGSTSYGITTSYTISNTSEESVSYSVGATAEAAAPGIKLTVGSGYTSGWSKSFEEAYEESYTLTFSAAEENNVLIQRTPVFMYMYEVQDAAGNWITSEDGAGTFQIAVPQRPVYQQLSVEGYNSFVGVYNQRINSDAGGLTAQQREDAILWSIKDKTLLGNAGDPSVYASSWEELGGSRIGSGAVLSLGVNGGSVTEEGSKSVSVTQGTSRSSGFYFEASISAGASFALGEAWAGVATNMEGSKSYGVSETNTDVKTVSGTVTNLSEGQTGIAPEILQNYAFNWTFGTWNLNLGRVNNRAVPVLGYTVSGLRSGIAAPQNLAAGKGASDHTVQLTWDAVENAEGYNLYLVENGSVQKVNTESPILDPFYSYSIPEETVAPSLTFVVTAIRGSSESVNSDQVIFYRSNAGKSAYDIARDNGFTGTEEEWLASLIGADGADGKDGVGIDSVVLDENGMLAITLTDGTFLTLGNVKGENGEDGVGIVGLAVNEAGELIVTLTDGSTVNIGVVVGPKGDPGEDGREIELRTTDTHIQWRYIGEDDFAWRNLIELSEIAGADGADGKSIDLQVSGGDVLWKVQDDVNWSRLISLSEITGAQGDKGDPGEDGREIELRTTDTHIQWRYVGEDDSAWTDLIELSEITGADGSDGKNIDLQVSGGDIQWKVQGDDNWTKLVALSEIAGARGEKGDKGDPGEDGKDGEDGEQGEDGREIELRTTDTHIQWRYSDEDDSAWRNLIELSAIAGADGRDGTDGRDGADGINGKNIDLQVADGYVQWRLQGNTEWTDLVSLSEITGAQDNKGVRGDTGGNDPNRKDAADKQTDSTGEGEVNGKNGADGEDGSDGERGPKGDPGEPGEPGRGVADIKIDGDGNFIFTMTDGSTINAGQVPEKTVPAMAQADDLSSGGTASATRAMATAALGISCVSLLWNIISLIGYAIRKRKMKV